MPVTQGYIKEFQLGDEGHFIPETIGGGAGD